jgi:hypothetical protein
MGVGRTMDGEECAPPMRPILCATLTILAICSSRALAGKNRDGALLVHTNDDAIYFTSADYCATALPATCDQLVATSHTPAGTEEAIIWFLAAFDPVTTPAVTTIQFGITTNLPPGAGYVAASGPCGPGTSLELPDAGFPDVGRGNLVSYTTPRTGLLWPFYWFAVRGREGLTTEFGTTVYPGDGRAVFVDDGDPLREDVVTNFGIVRWDTAGSNSCPVYVPPPTGACCTSWGSCVQNVTEEACEDAYGAYQGVYEGDGAACADIVCAACCYAFAQDLTQRRCVNASQHTCLSRFGYEGSNGVYALPSWAGPGMRCTYNGDSASFYWYCNEVPTQRRSWGVIKTLFR